VPSSTEGCFASAAPQFLANVFLEVSKKFQTELQAMALYERKAHQFFLLGGQLRLLGYRPSD
jgi:hypothetical protein